MFEIKVKIDGMMCSMCESHVNEAIRKAFDPKKVSSSHKSGECVIVSERQLTEEDIKNALSDTGYRILPGTYSCAPYEKKGFFASLFKK